jgi:hypothetical protein
LFKTWRSKKTVEKRHNLDFFGLAMVSGAWSCNEEEEIMMMHDCDHHDGGESRAVHEDLVVSSLSVPLRHGDTTLDPLALGGL